MITDSITAFDLDTVKMLMTIFVGHVFLSVIETNIIHRTPTVVELLVSMRFLSIVTCTYDSSLHAYH